MSKQVGNTAYILVYLFNFASRQHCEVWASQIPFLQNINDTVPFSKACLYGWINWSLAQGHEQSSFRLSQLSTSMRCSRAKLKAGFRFNIQKQPVPKSDGASLVNTKSSKWQEVRWGVSTSSTDSRKKGNCGGWSF